MVVDQPAQIQFHALCARAHDMGTAQQLQGGAGLAIEIEAAFQPRQREFHARLVQRRIGKPAARGQKLSGNLPALPDFQRR